MFSGSLRSIKKRASSNIDLQLALLVKQTLVKLLQFSTFLLHQSAPYFNCGYFFLEIYFLNMKESMFLRTVLILSTYAQNNTKAHHLSSRPPKHFKQEIDSQK